ncbi:UDP-N-acetylglucosamine 2-epimerase (non-hydrolyzing) [Mumia zhuanghuii]|uniref:UDP-N-acetylglucosamine 2-epimerase (Non-hydrolyzing) n=2 Tax=Mumia TaxID=1546255 RepID=A0A5Q6S1X8_9ACTN|nr:MULTISPECIES: UDP-N-acetylglucosamine 2-epimerase (non-hydrolyzing) [Mumia]KAA1418072.1 UDP-N-acetylglucosamine 2-epimerase (non-hydrolyzing) [Mumia zhuanghuii]KAA1424373.1 UDP-N-acetylglucosamine 2-epimerase (non-hydrolyzing) [Mumia zhuanghuii]
MSDLVMHITGARPNFPKAAPVVAALAERGVAQKLVHTGQHYDDNMSAVFFRELGLPHPDVNLGVGSGSHASQTAAIMTALEAVVLEDRPTLVMVYGDVNSTLAAALVASKLGIGIAHVEAGLRSFDWTMPEEINRVVTDRLADRLYATSADAVAHLGNEGVSADKIRLVGNPMIDTLLAHRDRFDGSRVRDELGLADRYGVATLHRPGNVDDPAALKPLVEALTSVADEIDIVLPVHPRGAARLEQSGLLAHPRVHAVDPVGYTEFLGLVADSALVVTDSGGIQEETTVLGVPCLTLRPNTERPVTITDGTNQLVNPQSLPAAAAKALAAGRPTTWPVPPLWDGHAGERIARDVVNMLD